MGEKILLIAAWIYFLAIAAGMITWVTENTKMNVKDLLIAIGVSLVIATFIFVFILLALWTKAYMGG